MEKICDVKQFARSGEKSTYPQRQGLQRKSRRPPEAGEELERKARPAAGGGRPDLKGLRAFWNALAR